MLQFAYLDGILNDKLRFCLLKAFKTFETCDTRNTEVAHDSRSLFKA